MTSHIYLSSRTSEGPSNYDAQWSIMDPRLQNISKYIVTIRSVEFPNTAYPINQYNNQLSITADGDDYLTVSISAGYYTGTTLATALQTALTTAMQSLVDADDQKDNAATFTVAYDTDTKLMSFSNFYAFAFVLCDNNMYEELGIGVAAFDAGTTTYTSLYPINISGTQYVDLQSNLAPMSYSNSSTSHILARVPVDVSFGNVVYYKNTLTDDLIVTNSHLNTIKIRLIDDKGNPYLLPDNAFLSVCLAIQTF